MEFNKEIFEKFLRNQCTDPEAEAVLAYLTEHPDELEKYIPLDDWVADDAAPLNITVSERMLQQIRETYEPVRRSTAKKWVLRYAVAASLIGLIVLAGLKWLTGTTKPATGGTVASTQHIGQELKTVENTTKQLMRIRLADSSVAMLYPNSSLQYLPEFEANKRELYLKGKAQFKVSNHVSRPFTVYAGGIATTVLGTSFLVTEKPNKKVSVLLMEGRVRVWSSDAADSNRSVLLSPGDEVAVTGGQFSHYSLVHNGGENRRNAPAEAAITKNGLAEAANTLVFKNNKLKEIFKKIEEKFGVTINDEKARGIEEKLFTGRFLEQDNLDFIVKTICNLYGLQYRIEGSIVTITPK
jgi:ferric-dicitrate binding protein FerR (iron transport regulator)